MKERILFDSIDGLMAYDLGATDSGIKDERLRIEVKNYLHELDELNFRLILTDYINEYFVNKESVKKGYGIEDVSSFIRWLDQFMDISL